MIKHGAFKVRDREKCKRSSVTVMEGGKQKREYSSIGLALALTVFCHGDLLLAEEGPKVLKRLAPCPWTGY